MFGWWISEDNAPPKKKTVRGLSSCMSCNPLVKSITLTLLVCFLRVCPRLLMHTDVARDTQRLEVVPVIRQPLHLCLSLATLDRYAMVTIYGTSHVAFGLAPLTQRMLSQIAQAQRLPSLVVQ